MKYPHSPSKPYTPYKPQPPETKIEQKKAIGTLSSQEDSEFTLQSFEELIKSQAPGVNPASIKFSWEIVQEYGYYDNVSTSLSLCVYTVSMIDNPNYEKLLEYYHQQITKYEKDYQKYRDDLKQYRKDEKKYKEDLEKYQIAHAKATIKRLISKTKKGQK